MLQPRGRDPQAITSAPLLGLGAAVTGAVRLVDCEAGAGPGSCNGATGDSAKAREAAAGAMAAPSPGPREALALSPEAGQRAATSNSSHRRGLFWRLRDKQTRLGLFEIGPRHELHGLASMMQAGLWAATQASIDHPPTPSDFSSELTSPKKPFLACCSQAPSPSFRAISLCWDRTGFRWPTCDRGHVPGLSSEPGAADPAGLPTQEDFSEVLTQVHEGFELGTLAGPAFARLRRSLGVAEEDYQAALGPGGPYLQFLSTSKSKASFFLSHDQRFFLKTQRRREVQVLLAHLPRYVQHLQRHPHSLLARLLEVLHHHAERLLPRRPHLREGRSGAGSCVRWNWTPPSSRSCECWTTASSWPSSVSMTTSGARVAASSSSWPGLCTGRRSQKRRAPRTGGCCPMAPTRCTSWTGPSTATSWASWTLPPSTGFASGWSIYGRRCVTRVGPSPPSARPATPGASASGSRRTPNERCLASVSPSGQ
ncbi:PREDICTED: phosphatidylinositol 4-phosphate 5-kinase-like protein 1 isoform X3 [Chinchilla lanigera]|uniref:phosphatidylinositol 4-phosphate 5-kinase-like protein 1 isoform X3 n=1 Tax=Chinchilla lanigera TaxID=34839 RepID=UPI000697854A|nr:PREDICTED: phosphatidylinositol 4-phosphate 5-kinase-like protein 1 isoform X3 [Chinchilla lanigera]